MNLIQEGRNFLDLIQHDPGPGRPATDQRLESMRIAREFEKERSIEQIKTESVGQNLLQPGALAGPPRSEQEKGSVGPLQQAGYEESAFHLHSDHCAGKLQCKFTSRLSF